MTNCKSFRLSRRDQGWNEETIGKSKPSLESVESPEGYEWYNKKACMLECKRCNRLVYVDLVIKHEMEYHPDDIPEELDGDIEVTPEEIPEELLE